VIESESLEIRIFRDVLRIIPQYKLMTVDLPKDHQRREDQEAYPGYEEAMRQDSGRHQHHGMQSLGVSSV